MRSALLCLFTLLVAIVFVGCGHPATEDECKRILRKSAELKLKEQEVNPELIELRTEQMMEAKGDELLSQCKGRRITDAILECVEKADSAVAVDNCLRR